MLDLLLLPFLRVKVTGEIECPSSERWFVTGGQINHITLTDTNVIVTGSDRTTQYDSLGFVQAVKASGWYHLLQNTSEAAGTTFLREVPLALFKIVDSGEFVKITGGAGAYAILRGFRIPLLKGAVGTPQSSPPSVVVQVSSAAPGFSGGGYGVTAK